ncbi:unnamed protein product [Phytomonas sp. EM1]|nr:unnamed protein product [Phytomonas sp. EM1]|eukprot:CCW64258.1 unnamed protein product [Phytomonas sp. isolate EM1]
MSTTTADAWPQSGEAPSALPQYDFAAPPSRVDFFLDLLVRFAIDGVQRAITAPAERLKVLTTVEGELQRQGRLPASHGFEGVFGCVRRVWRREGGRGFFRGVGVDLVLSLPAGFVDSLSMSLVSRVVQAVVPASLSDTIGLPAALAITMGATALAVVVASPYFALRRSIMTNFMADIVAPPPSRAEAEAAVKPNRPLEVDEPTTEAAAKEAKEKANRSIEPECYLYGSATEATQSIYHRQGLRAFYRGALVDPILVMVYRGLYIGASLLIPSHLQEDHPYSIVAGLSLVSDVLMQPLEVVGRRLILTASDDTHPPYNGIIDCAKSIVREEGATGLWRGLRCRVAINAVGLVIRVILGNLYVHE